MTIITPSFNQGKYIGETIRSVLSQNHDDVEHLVVDGGSRDGTLDILRGYPHLRWTSEPDSGQSEAINKGFRRATGEVLAWLNSDDYYEPNVLGDVAASFQDHPECMVLYGDITFVNAGGERLGAFTGGSIDRENLIRNPDIVRQPSFFWRRQVLDEIGFLDERLHLVMDFDFFLRLAMRYPLHYLNRNLSYFRVHGESKSLSQRRRQLLEIRSVYRKHGIGMNTAIARFYVRQLVQWSGIRKFAGRVVRVFTPTAPGV
ncbi:MAG: glycosyltransferase family 2 protein [Bacteroidota bacterium]